MAELNKSGRRGGLISSLNTPVAEVEKKEVGEDGESTAYKLSGEIRKVLECASPTEYRKGAEHDMKSPDVVAVRGTRYAGR
jgi:hypothetical protein